MMSKRKEKENELLAFLSEEERKSYEEFEKKLQAKRNVAVKRQKEEMAFWKKIDEREDEVLKHIMENREKRQAEKLKKEQDVQKAQMQNQTGSGNVTMTKSVTENRTVSVQNQNPQMQQKPVMQNYHQGQPTGQVGEQNPVAYRQP